MCGILGIVAPLGQTPSVEKSHVVAMRDSMTDRGPDDAGLLIRENVTLAHRRLAIRDLDAGSQPIVSSDGKAALVYNGEIYNDDELRDRLAGSGVHFRTRCDTETLLAAWQKWGMDCLAKLRGMFAFGVYDFEADRLFLVRDRFGVKPLFYAEIAGELVFASTIAAILRHPRMSRQPNWRAVSHYLTTFRTTLGSETMFAGIQQLRPAECLEWNLRSGQVQIHKYWNFPSATEHDRTFEEATDELEGLLTESTQSRLISDVPVGMFLSGGVDSSMLASIVSGSGSRQLLGSCGGGEFDEHPQTQDVDDDFTSAARCAKHTGFDFDEVRVTDETYRNTWESMIDSTCLPLSTPSDVIIHQLARRMKQDVGVVLGGEGADELLCGYSLPHWSVEDFRLAGLSRRGAWPGPPSSERAFLQSLEATYGRSQFSGVVDHYFAANSLVPLPVKPALLNDDVWQAAEQDAGMAGFYQNEFANVDAASDQAGPHSLVHTQAVLLHRLNLESLLARLDSATMLASLEARVPYTDHRLVEFAFRLPAEFRIDVDPLESTPFLAAAELDRRGSLRSKRLLRSVAARHLPQQLAQRRKASFPTPVASWLSGRWRSWAQQRLVNSPFGQQVFRRETLCEFGGNVTAAGMWLWPILNLLNWGDRVF